MAKYLVTHSCGHNQTHNLYGKISAREETSDWLSTTLCTDCWRAWRDTQPPKVYARPVQGGVEIIAVNSYIQREALRERGYRFGQYVLGEGLRPLIMVVDGPIAKGWALILRDEEAMEREAAWIDSQGWTIKVLGPLPDIVARLVAEFERRPDLVLVPGTPQPPPEDR